jgi:hypothetical protein
MNTIIKSLLMRLLQPASFAGYVIAGLAAFGYNPAAEIKVQIIQLAGGIGGLLLIVLNTKLSNDVK